MRSKEQVVPYSNKELFEGVWLTWSRYYNGRDDKGWRLIRGGALYWRKVKRDAKA